MNLVSNKDEHFTGDENRNTLLTPKRKKSELEEQFIDKVQDKFIRNMLKRKHKAMLDAKSREITDPDVFICKLWEEMKKSE